MPSTNRPDPQTLRARIDGAGFEGRIIGPTDADYDAARTVLFGGIDRRPAFVAKVANAADVVRLVRLAKETGAELAVRSGGHSSAGHSASEGGIVIDVRGLNAVEIDAEARTAWAGTGATAKAFSVAAAAHGLAVGFGDAGSVGLGGITLGGGVGYLTRKHGLTIDSLLAAEVATADGRIVVADAGNEPELFWAIRGGGGNFGVVTKVKFRLHPLSGITGGLLILPATAATISGFIAAAEAAPDEVSTIANVMPAPPMPFLPAELHGSLVIFAMLVHSGVPADADAALAPFRALAKPHADMLRPMALPEIYPPDDPDYHPTAVAQTMFMDTVDEALAQHIIDALKASTAPMRVVQLRVLGGAAARIPADATAYAHRKSRIMANVAAFFQGDADRAVREREVADLARSLRQSDLGAYVNFLGAEPEERVRAAYPGRTWDRLRAAKRQYDPDNLFRLNQNIPPAA
ncbi:MAG: FAD-binding oxidoreductase [Bauldia sp.]|nr:FAD-binding oxidoreductase [Bauldia sp.]